MHWFLLILSAVAEALFGIATFYSRGYTQLWPSIGAVAAGASTAVLLAFAMKGLPLGVAFAVWSGLAAVGTVVFGIIYLGESRSPLQLGLIATILGGVVGLKLISSN
ncbi:MAG: multidrug efflux SMR transporter [Verrucomicrobiaceae bacterium]|nr:multidrug efflux SMR transporter [Bryobacterales bacterium]MBL9144364.1 multidrug efflux SMR transporter [Verrucomicrobiaceae bacterium]